jgi:SAM-dependent methyltransferase
VVSLDVGCGPHKRGDIGIDYSKESCADIVADSHFLPFKEKVFDKVISVTVIEHSPNALNFLKEQARVLKRQGRVELITDNAQYYNFSVMRLGRGGILHWNFCKDHYGIFYPKNIERLMILAGFTVDKMAYQSNRKSKADIAAKILVKLGIWRKDCLCDRFLVTGTVISK